MIIKKVLGIHGMCTSIEKESRKNRIKLFKENGMDLELFQFNKEEDPSYQSWKKTFDKIDFSEYDAIYTNSLGGKATVRYLYNNNIKVQRLVMVVPGKSINTINGKYKNAQKILDYLNNKKLSNIASESIVISSKDDDIVPYKNGEKFAKMTQSHFILLENGGHKMKKHLSLIAGLVKNGKILTRKEYHAKKGKKVFGKDDCPFCFDFKSIWEGKYWYIVKNIAPYSGNDKHLMAVPFRHIKYSNELVQEEFSELQEIHKFVKNFYGSENYFSATRETMGNRSVEHLHMHFIPGRLQGKYLRKMLENQGFPINEELEDKLDKYFLNN